MANNCPIHNQNIVSLSNEIQDPVTLATVISGSNEDGVKFSKTFREQVMAEAYQWAVEEVLRKVPDKTRAQLLLSGAITTGSLSQVTAGIAVKKDYLETLKVVRSTASTPPYEYILPSQKAEADMDNLPDAKRVYTIIGGTLYSYTRTNGVLTADNSITLTHYYFKRERISATDGTLGTINATVNSVDVMLDSRWHPACIQMAAFFALSRLGDGDSKALAQGFFDRANQLFAMQLGA